MSHQQQQLYPQTYSTSVLARQCDSVKLGNALTRKYFHIHQS